MKTHLISLWLMLILMLSACGAPSPQTPVPTGQKPAGPPPQQSPGQPPPPPGQNPPPAGNTAQPPASPPANSGAAMYTQGQSSEALPQEDYLAQVNSAANSPTWAYQTTLIATLPYPQKYDLGAFCRIFPAASGAGYEVIFGGAFNARHVDENRRYQGDVRRTLSADLSTWGEPQQFSTHGGDYAIDTDGQYFYLLNADPQGWRLGKYDADFNLAKEVIVPLPAGHAGNDQMLRVWDGRIYLSGLYNPNTPDMHSNKDAAPDETLYTHLWIYDTDLNPLGDHILDDEPNINGGTLIPYGDGFAYLSAENMRRNNLKAYLYDADWNFIRSVPLEEDGQWSMGGMVDANRIYTAYHLGEHMDGDVMLDIFDKNWQQLEQIQVTAVQDGFNAQRPWVLVDGDRLFVSYDVARDAQGILDFQCLISVYVRAGK